MGEEPQGDEIRLWVDDDLIDRAAPPSWIHVLTAWDAIRLLRTGLVIELSLDHDLGDEESCGRGVDVVDYLIEQQESEGRVLWPRDGITLHTANPVGRDTMARAIERYAGKTREVMATITRGGHRRFTFR